MYSVINIVSNLSEQWATEIDDYLDFQVVSVSISDDQLTYHLVIYYDVLIK